jgi:hypothetical protein
VRRRRITLSNKQSFRLLQLKPRFKKSGSIKTPYPNRAGFRPKLIPEHIP